MIITTVSSGSSSLKIILLCHHHGNDLSNILTSNLNFIPEHKCLKMEPLSTHKPQEAQQAFNIHQYDAHLALAFQSDCETLLNKFSELRSNSFDDFARLWRDTCFMAIFNGQEYILTIRVFLENCFYIVKKFLFSTDPYVQVGAIYVLHALYYKQPIRQWVKIRLTQVETDQLHHIAHTHRLNGHLEPLFICSKMRLDGAFQYCALVQPLALDAKFSKRVDLASESIGKKPVRNPLDKFKELMHEDRSVKDLGDTDREYQNRVERYKKRCKRLHTFPSNICKELEDIYTTVSKEPPGEEEDRVTEVKKRAMSNKNAIYRAETVITGLDLDTQ